MLCPKCGSRKFYFITKDNKRVYGFIDRDLNFLDLNNNPIDKTSIDTSKIFCADCVWEGSINNLVKIFRY